jgi:hypothetical protein
MQPASNGQPADKGRKANRIRTRYSTGEVPHLWANGHAVDVHSTSSRTERTPDGLRLISYATPVGNRLEAFTPEGCRVYLLASRTYSKTTSKMLGRAEAAIPFKAESPNLGLWDGNPFGMPYELASQGGHPLDLCSVVFHVPNLGTSVGIGRENHKENLRHLIARAFDLSISETRKGIRFYVRPIASAFVDAIRYHRTFLADEPEPFAGFDFAALAARIKKAKARGDAAAAKFERDRRDITRAEDKWIADNAELLGRIAEAVRSTHVERSGGLVGILRAFEAGEIAKLPSPGDSLFSGPNPIASAVGELINHGHLYRTGLDRSRAFINLMRQVCPDFPSPADFVPPFPLSPERCVFGKRVRDFTPNYHKVLDAVGLAAFRESPHKGAFGRDLVQVRAGELKTTAGASVPVAVVRALWGRHGAEVKEAALSPYALRFPEPRRAGLYLWTGYQPATPAAAATDSGASLLQIGCHLIGAADLVRLASRMGWEDPA